MTKNGPDRALPWCSATARGSRRFGADRDVIGRTCGSTASRTKIVGVMPREFQFPAGDRDVESGRR